MYFYLRNPVIYSVYQCILIQMQIELIFRGCKFLFEFLCVFFLVSNEYSNRIKSSSNSYVHIRTQLNSNGVLKSALICIEMYCYFILRCITINIIRLININDTICLISIVCMNIYKSSNKHTID